MLRRGTQEEIIVMKKEVLDRCIDKKILCKEGSKILHMHPKSFSRLKWRYIREGEQALVPKKTGPKQFTPKNRTPDHIEKMGKLSGIISVDENRSEICPILEAVPEKISAMK